jgi:uncharacterized membrane protein YciS (DUF1049 family)
MARKKIEMNSSVSSAVKGVIEERKEKHQESISEPDDVLVSLGDLTEAKLEDITAGKNFETIALDYITTFNMAVAQGIFPPKALLAMTQATSIVMGNCIRAGLQSGIAIGMIMDMAEHAKKASKSVNIITKN